MSSRRLEAGALEVIEVGRAYFVSYGTEWPQLIIVLQGDGVTIDLHGETHITKGITSSTFKTVPDAPVESFELTLPESEHPALAAPGGKLCQKKLVMPTSFIAQNGATLKQNTKIKVTGCAATKKKKAKHARKVRKGAKQGKHARANGKAVGERRS